MDLEDGMAKKNKKKKTAGDYLLTLGLLIALGVFAFAGWKLYGIYMDYKQAKDEYKKLEDMAVQPNPNGVRPGEDGAPADEPPIVVDFAALQAENPDVVGWLYVEALGISYPVVQGTDNEYYLHMTYQKTYNFAGTIFIDHENSRDFQDLNTIVYGHNMKDGSMFGILKRFVTENAYATSPYFWMLTPEKNYKYEIFSAYTAQINSLTYTLYSKPGQEFTAYLKQMKANSEIETSAEPKKFDKIMTLSTCTGNSATRFVVQGIQMD